MGHMLIVRLFTLSNSYSSIAKLLQLCLLLLLTLLIIAGVSKAILHVFVAANAYCANLV